MEGKETQAMRTQGKICFDWRGNSLFLDIDSCSDQCSGQKGKIWNGSRSNPSKGQGWYWQAKDNVSKKSPNLQFKMLLSKLFYIWTFVKDFSNPDNRATYTEPSKNLKRKRSKDLEPNKNLRGEKDLGIWSQAKTFVSFWKHFLVFVQLKICFHWFYIFGEYAVKKEL